ncbi:hypothetical protein L1987_36190 [Smallanthus sonchifolius]|uniref:Uncharacterized protein n=1 Tax=Smallanthus sonchifolius TaxID=185202 RepID=A0ACB9HE73_9ASTR|nr:hypothetical protein L1987_36190 [Smallanthus sonchifolius]
MASAKIYLTLFLLLPLLTTIAVAALLIAQVNSNSVLVALLDSRYTDLSEQVEKALLLQTLEEAVANHNITIFAPRNEALERDLHPEFKRFLLEPRNLRSLQSLLLHHVVPTRVGVSWWPYETTRHNTLSNDPLHLSSSESVKFVGSAEVVSAEDVVRNDGIIHGIGRLMIPKSVQQDFNTRRSLRAISAVKPEGAPEVDPRTSRLKKPSPPVAVGSPPVLPVYSAMSPGPSLAPAPAPDLEVPAIILTARDRSRTSSRLFYNTEGN